MGGQVSVVSPNDDLRELAQTELALCGRTPNTLAPKSLVPSGETRDIHRAGGRYLTLVGTNPFFHLPQDRWPHARCRGGGPHRRSGGAAQSAADAVDPAGF